eukprot:CAMPEP_0117421214 /NCGR_PEP_ID=MMETSP0758-20121206/2373_1 /TAXON_ID=63605 /ORGANISM="Percolomonas cosmopolitus, Strain AE-1 (ATCC 50343)" /LENGTH=273 /DNA_ID=CAMNT_0005203249 /DNA_START=228 /DNA_END=1049 /DNA_ORIENTATION=-
MAKSKEFDHQTNVIKLLKKHLIFYGDEWTENFVKQFNDKNPINELIEIILYMDDPEELEELEETMNAYANILLLLIEDAKYRQFLADNKSDYLLLFKCMKKVNSQNRALMMQYLSKAVVIAKDSNDLLGSLKKFSKMSRSTNALFFFINLLHSNTEHKSVKTSILVILIYLCESSVDDQKQIEELVRQIIELNGLEALELLKTSHNKQCDKIMNYINLYKTVNEEDIDDVYQTIRKKLNEDDKESFRKVLVNILHAVQDDHAIDWERLSSSGP